MRKNKIRILHVAQAAGGVDRYIRMLLKYLDKEKFENILVCSQDFHEEDYRDLVDSFEQVEMTRAIGGNDLKAIKEVRTLIMTLHKSKGLEFNIVFHMDMYKWIIPNEYGDESSVQQDLNLHYVGLTRAKDACYIMNGTARFRSKKNDYIFAEPSSFLSKPGLAERRKDVRWEM